MYICVCLVHFDVQVNVADEFETRVEADRAEHQAEHVAGEQRVAEELNGLQAARHVATFDEKEYGVGKHEQASRTI